MTIQSSHQAPGPVDPMAPPPRSSAIMGVTLTAGLTIAILALLFYHSIASPVPRSKLIVRGDPSWIGCTLSVEGGALSEPRESFFEPLGNYVVPFFLPPGTYRLHVRSQGVEVYARDVTLARDEIQEVDMLATGATTLPATDPTSQPAP